MSNYDATAPGNVVTNAKPGYSHHNFGLAFDFAVLKEGRPLWDQNHPHWNEFVRIAKEEGFAWGGDWSSFKDYPHLELANAPSLASLRVRFPRGWTAESDPPARWQACDDLPLRRGHKDGTKRLVSRVQQRLRADVDGPARWGLPGHRHEPLGRRVDRRRSVRNHRVRPDHRRAADPPR